MILTPYSSAHCELSHAHHQETIWSGYSGRWADSFGAFIAAQPIGAEVHSISGRICRWTGRYTMKSGHRAAVLQVLDRPEMGEIGIHCCGDCVWAATGHIVSEDGGTRDRRFDLWPASLGERRIREAREEVAARRADPSAR